MTRFLAFIIAWVLFSVIPQVGYSQIFAPEGVNIPGQWNGFTNSNDPAVMDNFRMKQRSFGGGQYITTLYIAAQGGDTTAGTYNMLFTSGPDANPYANKWVDATLSIDGFSSVAYQGSSDNVITVENGNYYTLILKDNGYQNTEAAVFKTSAEPVLIDTATGVPVDPVTENDPVTITVELNKAKSAEEKIYVRYSTDGFSTSEAIEVTGFSGGTTGSVNIPGQPKNSVVEFYLLSTTIDKSGWGGKPDLATIRYNNNGGSNYRYFYEANVTPLNGAEDVGLSPGFSWYEVENQAGYDFQVDDNADFSSPVIDQSGLTDTTYSASVSLDIYTEYYWRFKADTASAWSNIFSFRTESAITFANVQFPVSAVVDEGSEVLIYGQVFVPGITEQAGESSDINAWIGINDTDTNPETWGETSWSEANFNSESTTAGDNDEYFSAQGGTLSPGTYYYAFRYRYQDQDSVYGVLGGIWDDTTQTLGELVILDVPELNQPADSETGVPLEPDLTWSTSDESIAGYSLQVSDDATFTSPLIDEVNLAPSSTTYKVSSGLLDYENIYYWRVRSEYDTTNSGWSESFSFTTTKDIPGAVTLNDPDDQESDVGLQPTLSWSNEEAAESYNLQVSSDSGFSSPELMLINKEGITSTEYTLSDTTLLSAETYYWRVQGKNTAGAGPWSPALAFTTVISVPELMSPVNGGIDVPASPSLTWKNIPAAISYDVQISSNSSFAGNNVVADSSAFTDTLFIAENLELTETYYWRVRANYASTSSEWSGVFSFTVKDAPPLQPTLLNPDSGAIHIETDITLNWEAATDAESYKVQLSTTEDFSSGFIIDSAGVTTTSIQAPELERQTTHYWRVQGYNTSGGFGEWSTVGAFTTLPFPPTEVNQLSPADSLSQLPVPVIFTWNSVANAHSYEFRFSKDDTFTFTSDSVTADTAISLSGFEPGTGYSWQVRAVNAGGESGWSPARYFETGVGGFSGPVLISPENEAMDTGTEIEFEWEVQPGADFYHFQVGENPDFTSLHTDSTGIAGANLSISGLQKGKAYFWRVRSVDDKGESKWSSVYSFNTEQAIPGRVSVVAPADSADELPLPVTFKWNPQSGAGFYEVRISEQPDFNISIDSSSIADTTLTLAKLSYNTGYYWKVRAVNGAGAGKWSAISFFTTSIQVPSVPEPVNPESGEAVTGSVRFGWNEADRADSYDFQISNASTFESINTDTSLAGLTIQVEGFEPGNTYYWRIRGVNRAGAGAWSDTLHFTAETITSIGREGIPADFKLHPNYPNPFNPTTTIQYDVKHAGQVSIKVYDISGRLIKTLINEAKNAGRYRVTFDAGSLASGMYVMRMEAPGFLQIRKMTLIK